MSRRPRFGAISAAARWSRGAVGRCRDGVVSARAPVVSVAAGLCDRGVALSSEAVAPVVEQAADSPAAPRGRTYHTSERAPTPTHRDTVVLTYVICPACNKREKFRSCVVYRTQCYYTLQFQKEIPNHLSEDMSTLKMGRKNDRSCCCKKLCFKWSSGFSCVVMQEVNINSRQYSGFVNCRIRSVWPFFRLRPTSFI